MSRMLEHYAKKKTAFMCIDLQKAFAERIANFPNCVAVANRFAAFHNIVPQNTKYIITEQYPKGLGSTVPEIAIPKTAFVAAKTRFSAVVPEVEKELADVHNVVIFGIEGHVCVMQTVAELLDMNKRVVLCVDGVGSQKSGDREAALKLMGTWGPNCMLCTSESLILQMTKDAKDAEFKKISGVIKDPLPQPF